MDRATARHLAAAFLSCVVALPLSASPLQTNIDARAVEEAVRLGRSQDAGRLAAFHAAYRIPVDDAIIRQVEIVTEYRRVVQMTEERAGLRDLTWDAARAARELAPARGLASVVLDLQFSPQNTYRSMPSYSVAIYRRGPASSPIPPVDSATTQAYVSGQPAPPGTPILAARVEASFDASTLDPQGQYLLAVFLAGREVRRIPIDFGSVR